MKKIDFPICDIVGNTTNIGYIELKDERVKVTGFGGLINHRAKIDLKRGIVVIVPDSMQSEDQSIDFNEDALSNKVMIDLLKQKDCFGCLFVRIWGIWTQCKNVTVASTQE